MMKPAASPVQWKLNALFVGAIGLILVVSLNPSLLGGRSPDLSGSMPVFKTMLISIVLEAVPFLMLGVLVSSIMHVLVPESWIRRVIPRNPLAGTLVACLLGVVLSVCECGLIPVVRRLIAKGMPLYAGVTFILVGPIVNPVVWFATFAAFRLRPEMVYARMGLAVAVGVAVGLTVYWFVKYNPLRENRAADLNDTVRHHEHHRQAPAPAVLRPNRLNVTVRQHEHHHTHDRHDHHHSHDHAHQHNNSGGKIEQILRHAGSEFFDMGKYLMIGALITAAIQSFIPRSELIAIGQGAVPSHLFMMGFAYLLSLCSTSDAFVASSFVSTFSAGSLLAFLVFGPMLDLKGTLMLLSAFKAKFVLLLSVLVTVAVLTGSAIAGRYFLW